MASNQSSSKWSGRVQRVSERFFYWWGRTLAANPYKVILAVIVLAGLATLREHTYMTSAVDGRSKKKQIK